MKISKILAGLTAAAALVAATPMHHPLEGKWNVEYERGRQNMNGEVTVLTGKALLEIVEKGDSLIATLTPEPPAPGRSAPPPSRMAAKGEGNGAKFLQSGESRINM